MVTAQGVRVGIRQTWVPTLLRASWVTWAVRLGRIRALSLSLLLCEMGV